MATIDFAYREITARIVYFGAPGAGSNSNVRTLHGLLAAKEKSRLHHFGPPDASEESWYFDYVPPGGGQVPGFATRFRVYSMPGGALDAVHRKQVFDGVDAVILVADARTSRSQGNVAAARELDGLLAEAGSAADAIALVVQVNHGDAPDAREPADVAANINPRGAPVIGAVARASRGVLETHEKAVETLAAKLRANLAGETSACSLVAIQRDTIERDEEVVAKHVAAIEAAVRKRRTSLELDLHDLQKVMIRRYLALTPGPTFEVPFQPREIVGTKPVHLIEARLDGDQIHLDVVVDRLSGGEPRRLQLLLANRPMDATPVPRTASTGTEKRERVTKDLPDKIELPPPPPADFSPVWYGVAGVCGGAIVGVLLGFLVFS